MGVVRKFTPRPPSPDRFPHLSAFLSGYLHQDFVLDHETPAAALAAFLSEAGAEERAALREEWRNFRAAVEGLLWRDARQAFAALGGAWRPRSRAALLGLFDALEQLTDT
jgi:hypothetical protein